jgi:DNA/RNA-binding protein KIN17
MDGEERERANLANQIERAKAQEALRVAAETPNTGLQKKEGEKITLSFQPVSVSTSAPAPSDTAGPSGSTPLSFGNAIASSSTPIPVNPLKRPASTNVFKSAKQPKVAKTEDEGDAGASEPAPKKYKSEAERLMKEDQARKAGRSGGGGGYSGIGPVRTSKPNLGRTY